MKTTNYYNTFIEIADDCPVTIGQIPPQKRDEKTVATLQFEMISSDPYKYTSDDVIFSIYASKNNIAKNDFDEEKEKFFSKGQPCFRSSPLPKRYGWGIHSNAEGKIAIYAIESDEYTTLSKDTSLTHLKAMRSSKK